MEIKRRLFDKYGKKSELYRPLIYWFYVINPINRGGIPKFSICHEIEPIIKMLSVKKEFTIYLEH